MTAYKIIIDSGQRSFLPDFRELRQFRDLFLTLAYRDIRVRYAQTFLGLFWAFIQPAATLLIFTLIFGQAIKVETGGVPYPLFALAGLIPWTYFAFVMKEAGGSVIAEQNMIRKIYFPRLIIPLSKAVVGLVDLAVVIFFYLILMIWFGYSPSVTIVWLPLFLLAGVLAALGAGIWLSALTIRFRDFQVIVPFLIQLGIYISPVAYPSSLIPEKFHWLYFLNPMAGVIEGFRWSLLSGDVLPVEAFISFGVILVLFLSSLVYFRRVETVIADII